MSEIQEAIRIAADRILEEAEPNERGWRYAPPAGLVSTAFTLAVRHYAGVLSARDTRLGRAFLERRQQPDGSYLPYEGASAGTIHTTAMALAGLHAVGESRAIDRARRFIETNGGADALDPASLVSLCLVGGLPPDRLTSLSTAAFLVPGMLEAAANRLSAGALMYSMALSAIRAELQCAGRHLSGMGLRWLENRKIVAYISSLQNPNGSIFNRLQLATSV